MIDRFSLTLHGIQARAWRSRLFGSEADRELLAAAARGDLEGAREALRLGARPGHCEAHGRNAAHYGAHGESLAIVAELGASRSAKASWIAPMTSPVVWRGSGRGPAVERLEAPLLPLAQIHGVEGLELVLGQPWWSPSDLRSPIARECLARMSDDRAAWIVEFLERRERVGQERSAIMSAAEEPAARARRSGRI